MFRIAVITAPERIPDEAQALWMIGNIPSVCALHLRKPGYSESEIRSLLESLPPQTRGKIRLHEHFELCAEYGLQGVHLNHRNPTPPPHIRSISASCHSLQEVQEKKNICDYVFLSPVFDSISKQGYKSGFSLQTLEKAALDGLIDGKVLALGGVQAKHIPLLRQLGFGGAGMLGEIWQYYRHYPDPEKFDVHLKNIFHKMNGTPWR